MKNSIKSTALMVAVIFTQVACEKESNEPSNSFNTSSNVENTSKKKSNNNKSEGFTYDEIDEYVTDLENSNDPSSKDWDDAILLIESAVNHTEGTLGEVSSHSEMLSFSAEVYITAEDEDFIIEGEDAAEAYSNLVSELSDAVGNSDLYNEFGSEAFVSAIDLYYDSPPSSSGAIVVYGKAMLKSHQIGPAYPFCSTDYSWKALDRLGKCTSGGSLDAAIRLESFLTNEDCNSQKVSWYCQVYLTHVGFASNNGFNTTNLWDGTASSNCIASNAIQNTWFPGAQTEAYNIAPTLPNNVVGGQIDYMVGKRNAVSPQSGVAHELTVTYAAYWCPPIDL
jgi:hypothetical protein